GATAPGAAGEIHSDFQRGGMKAEVISYAELVEAGSLAAARAAGTVRTEGKDYVKQDGNAGACRINVCGPSRSPAGPGYRWGCGRRPRSGPPSPPRPG